MSSHKINHANIKEWAKNYNGPLFDGILCDPPYELGFMGKSWDSSGIAFDAEMWADILKLLKPGGHLLAFSGSRTYHRMAVAIEDAGFEIRDMIEWVYGSGFPKSLNIGKAVDKIQGNEREVTGYAKSNPDLRDVGRISKEVMGIDKLSFGQAQGAKRQQTPIDKGTSPYEGYGTALKPAHEPCVLARKPIEGTVANNVLKHGTGGLNIDGTRVGTETTRTTIKDLSQAHGNQFGKAGITYPTQGYKDNPPGRFPANLIHDGSDEVLEVFPQTKSGGGKRRPNDWNTDVYGMSGGASDYEMEASSGSASRFFYCAKAGKSERNAGLEGFEPKPATTRMNASMVRMENGVATNERAEQSVNGNHHPTVKPLSLTKYLATLIKPPTGGRLLVPFSGSGSEMIGALQAGWEFVEGVELTEEYIPIAEARIKYWTKDPEQRKLL